MVVRPPRETAPQACLGGRRRQSRSRRNPYLPPPDKDVIVAGAGFDQLVKHWSQKWLEQTLWVASTVAITSVLLLASGRCQVPEWSVVVFILVLIPTVRPWSEQS
jgi:hypothetical protein